MRLRLTVFVAMAALVAGETAVQAVSKKTTPTRESAILYEEVPDIPTGRRLAGTVIWRTEAVRPGPRQAPELAIRAEIEIPERALAMTWKLRRNIDKSMLSSHVIEIRFKACKTFPLDSVLNVPGILMKETERARGAPLGGLARKVSTGSFQIGLSDVDADKERNLQMLRERAWFDIPVVYSSGRRAILAIEKGTTGVAAFDKAFAAWGKLKP